MLSAKRGNPTEASDASSVPGRAGGTVWPPTGQSPGATLSAGTAQLPEALGPSGLSTLTYEARPRQLRRQTCAEGRGTFHWPNPTGSAGAPEMLEDVQVSAPNPTLVLVTLAVFALLGCWKRMSRASSALAAAAVLFLTAAAPDPRAPPMLDTFDDLTP